MLKNLNDTFKHAYKNNKDVFIEMVIVGKEADRIIIENSNINNILETINQVYEYASIFGIKKNFVILGFDMCVTS